MQDDTADAGATSPPAAAEPADAPAEPAAAGGTDSASADGAERTSSADGGGEQAAAAAAAETAASPPPPPRPAAAAAPADAKQAASPGAGLQSASSPAAAAEQQTAAAAEQQTAAAAEQQTAAAAEQAGQQTAAAAGQAAPPAAAPAAASSPDAGWTAARPRAVPPSAARRPDAGRPEAASRSGADRGTGGTSPTPTEPQEARSARLPSPRPAADRRAESLPQALQDLLLRARSRGHPLFLSQAVLRRLRSLSAEECFAAGAMDGRGERPERILAALLRPPSPGRRQRSPRAPRLNLGLARTSSASAAPLSSRRSRSPSPRCPVRCAQTRGDVLEKLPGWHDSLLHARAAAALPKGGAVARGFRAGQTEAQEAQTKKSADLRFRFGCDSDRQVRRVRSLLGGVPDARDIDVAVDRSVSPTDPWRRAARGPSSGRGHYTA
eukprot:TRINITY_DN6828_c0_g1_i5.p1 TRINITY_DN6828_c0_g1~~TRINITY_DN6828_c0_g1_i5.p1  ORF type:complete len:439 (+),score=142.00 TRINITY_DN6828_c0_g1_i5:94-1410(+)